MSKIEIIKLIYSTYRPNRSIGLNLSTMLNLTTQPA